MGGGVAVPGGGRKGAGVMADKFGFFRSYGGSTTRPDDDGSMDIELLDSAQGLQTPARANTARAKVEEPSAVTVTPMGAKGLDAAV